MMNSYQSYQHAVATEHLAAAHARHSVSSRCLVVVVIEMSAAMGASHWCLAILVSKAATLYI